MNWFRSEADVTLTQIVGRESWVLELSTYLSYVFIGASHEEDRLKVLQLFGWDVVD